MRQHGFKTVSFTSVEGDLQGLVQVVFPAPFASAPGVNLTRNGTNAACPPHVEVAAVNVSATGFDLDFRVTGDHAGFARSFKVFWEAVK